MKEKRVCPIIHLGDLITQKTTNVCRKNKIQNLDNPLSGVFPLKVKNPLAQLSELLFLAAVFTQQPVVGKHYFGISDVFDVIFLCYVFTQQPG